jgi:hypothetical protein
MIFDIVTMLLNLFVLLCIFYTVVSCVRYAVNWYDQRERINEVIYGRRVEE